MTSIYRKPRTTTARSGFSSAVVGDCSVTSIGIGSARGSRTQRYAAERRKKLTPAENALREILGKFGGGALRNQLYCQWAFGGKWILDFCLTRIRLGIEVDGGYHNTYGQRIRDAEKTRDCEKFEITLLRITNKEVMGDRGELEKKLRAAIVLASLRTREAKLKEDRKPETKVPV